MKTVMNKAGKSYDDLQQRIAQEEERLAALYKEAGIDPPKKERKLPSEQPKPSPYGGLQVPEGYSGKRLKTYLKHQRQCQTSTSIIEEEPATQPADTK